MAKLLYSVTMSVDGCDGVRLFDCPGGATVRFERLSLAAAPKAANLRFRVVQ